MSYATVLVPLDGSELGEKALGPAQRLAALFAAELHIVVGAVHRDELWWYHGYVEGLQKRTPALIPHLSDDPDVAAAVISTSRASDPCLVCMATHGRSRTAAIVGSTFAAIAARRALPLVAVGPNVLATDHETGPSDRLAVCLDGSPAAEKALPLAAAWARRLGLRVTLLTVADPVLLPRGFGGDPEAYLYDIAQRPTLDGLMVDTTVLWGPAYPHVSIGGHIERHPAELIVATSHARTGLPRAALGSEVARIIHRSPVPVLVEPLPHA